MNFVPEIPSIRRGAETFAIMRKSSRKGEKPLRITTFETSIEAHATQLPKPAGYGIYLYNYFSILRAISLKSAGKGRQYDAAGPQ